MNALTYNSALPENRGFEVVVQARSGLISILLRVMTAT